MDIPTIETLASQLQATQDDAHIVVGDFNLHHPSWGGAHCLTQHRVADRLIEVMEAVDLDLALPLGTTTWWAHTLCSTIDLCFISAVLTPRLLACGVSKDHQQSSDHLPILTILDLSADEAPPQPQQAWDHTDTCKLTSEFKR